MRVEGEILIERPPEAVFDIVADERNEPRYNPRMTEVRMLSPEPIGVGSRFSAIMTGAGGPAAMIIEVTAFERPNRLSSTTHLSKMDIEGTLVFEPVQERTRMRWVWMLHPRGFTRLLGPVVRRIGERQEREIWTGLKRVVESGPRPMTAGPRAAAGEEEHRDDHSVEPRAAPTTPAAAAPASAQERTIYRTGAWAAIAVVALVAINGVSLLLHPIPATVLGHFRQLQENKLVGLVNLDLVMLISQALAVVMYLALYTALRRASRGLASVGVALALIGIFLYFTINPTFSFLYLSEQYATASTAAAQASLLAAGEALWANYQGTAFGIFYLLSAVATLIVAAAMLRTRVFSRLTACVGLVLGAATLIPPLPSLGQVGVIASYAALLPMVVFQLLLAWRLLHLAGRSPESLPPAGAHWREES